MSVMHIISYQDRPNMLCMATKLHKEQSSTQGTAVTGLAERSADGSALSTHRHGPNMTNSQ